MKEKYYGVDRSEAYLAHYGIKGMKWGVKKAKESGNERKLARQYKKAAKKLSKLNERADIETQTSKANKAKTVSAISGSLGATSFGVAGLGNVSQKILWKNHGKKALSVYQGQPYKEMQNALNVINNTKVNSLDDLKKVNDARHKFDKARELAQKRSKLTSVPEGAYIGNDDLQKLLKKDQARNQRIIDHQAVASLVGAAGLATSLGSGAKYAVHKYRTTAKGHAKAVAKRDAWKKEMKSAFKGTSYANLPPYAKKKVKHSDLEDPNALSHYGIKGMKWGVQKAKVAGNDYQLGKHYMKAQKKLNKLEKKANAGKMSEEGTKHFKKAGLAGLDTGAAATVGGLAGLSSYLQAVGTGKVRVGSLGLTGLGAGAAAVGLGRTAYHLGKGVKRKIQSSYRYNQKAQAKRDAFKSAMNESFKGTKYAKKRR